MNPLLSAQHCELYRLDATFMTKAKFSQPSPGSITLIFSDKPNFVLPERFYLMPAGEEFDFISYFCTLTGSFREFFFESTEHTYYMHEAVTKDTPELREELRVDVSVDIDAVFDDPLLEATGGQIRITAKNISAGGMMFVSDKDIKKGTTFSFIFSQSKSSVMVNARVLNRRPTRFPELIAYGCQFGHLSSKAEGAIRNFVFNEDLIQRRKRGAFT